MEGNYVMRRDNDQKKRNKDGEEMVSMEENSWGSSWAARNYACSFCKREFRSAQGLGGHMNVHRRDRARLRSGMIPPLWLHTNSDSPHHHKPNPITSSRPSSSNNPTSLTLSSCVSDNDNKSRPPMLVTSSSKFPLLQNGEMIMNSDSSRSLFGSSMKGELMKGCAAKEEGLKCFEDIKEDSNNNITLELGLGLLQNPKEHIDLELRLG